MLVETDTGGKGEVGAEADEHPAPAAIVDIKVILHDPALGQLQMPAVVLFVANGGQDAGWFSCLQDEHHLVGFGMIKAAISEPNAILVMLEECVHDKLLCSEIPRA